MGKTHRLGKKKAGNRGRYVSRMRHAVSTGGESHQGEETGDGDGEAIMISRRLSLKHGHQERGADHAKA